MVTSVPSPRQATPATVRTTRVPKTPLESGGRQACSARGFLGDETRQWRPQSSTRGVSPGSDVSSSAGKSGVALTGTVAQGGYRAALQGRRAVGSQ